MRILFVDDVPLDIELAQIELQAAGLEFESRSEESEEGFLQALASFLPDIVICDYVMPRFDGLRALALLRARAPSIPFIMLTGAIDEITAVACMKAGADDYVLKEHLAQLPFAVREALARTARRSEEEKRYSLWKAGEDRFSSVYRDIGIALLVADPERLIIVDFNRMAGDFFGLSPQSPGATSLSELFHIPEPELRAHLESASAGKLATLALRHRGADGSLRDMEIDFGFVSHGSARLVSCTVSDITGRKASETKLRALAADVCTIDEEERCRLATQLHDGIGQDLIALRIDLEALAGTCEAPQSAELMGRVLPLLSKATESLHSAVFALSLPVLRNFGFAVALEQEAEDICTRHGLGFSFETEDLQVELPLEPASLLVRCVQELLGNIVDHAQARHVVLRLSREAAELRISVADDGKGFQTDQRQGWTRAQGFGLFSTETRLAAFGGRMEIDSRAGSTVVSLLMPCPQP